MQKREYNLMKGKFLRKREKKVDNDEGCERR